VIPAVWFWGLAPARHEAPWETAQAADGISALIKIANPIPHLLMTFPLCLSSIVGHNPGEVEPTQQEKPLRLRSITVPICKPDFRGDSIVDPPRGETCDLGAANGQPGQICDINCHSAVVPAVSSP
jgi:hypothetical protein